MPIGHEHEYASLRQEMLDRFERIHDTLKFGIGGFIAFLSIYLVIPDSSTFISIPDGIAILIMWAIIAFIGLSALNNFQMIYKIGTYISFLIEKNNDVKWHRMSRKYSEYLSDKKKIWKIKKYIPGPIGQMWGSDSTMVSIILIILFLASWGIVKIKTGSILTCIPTSPIPWILFTILILTNLYLFCILTVGMKRYREKTESNWKEYKGDFKDSKYNKFYE